MKFDCEDCGIVDYVLIDGYGCGDRLLEGVMFKVAMQDGLLKAEVMPGWEAYFEQLNPNWLDKIAEHVDCYGECPNCGKDIYLSESDDN